MLDCPCADLWLNSSFVKCFHNFEVRLPTEADTRNVQLTDYPADIKLPPVIRPRGRPRVKRIRTRGVPVAKMGVGKKGARKCGLCQVEGHCRTKCPVRLQYKL